MTSANLELVRSIHESGARGDWSSAEWADPEIEFVLADGLDAGSCSGVSAMTAAWRDFLSAWESYRVEPLEYREFDDERVCVLLRISGRGKSSGLQMDQTAANVFTLGAGKVTRLVIYWDADGALAEARASRVSCVDR